MVLALEDSLKKEKEVFFLFKSLLQTLQIFLYTHLPILSALQLRSPLESRLKETEELQRQLETRILELEKMKEQEQEEKRKSVEAVEKQVRSPSMFTSQLLLASFGSVFI